MSSPLASLQPSVLWKHFDALRCIPRPSGHEEAVMAHLRSWAEARGLAHRGDAVGNLVIYVPGTKGREKAPTVILQGHVDMVTEKDKSTDFDFLKDPIEVVVEGDWVIAPKTTLGADNGIGVAAAQAVADDTGRLPRPARVALHRGRGDRFDGGDERRREPAHGPDDAQPGLRGRRDAVRGLCRRLHDRSGLRPVAQRQPAGLDRAGDQCHRTQRRPFGDSPFTKTAATRSRSSPRCSRARSLAVRCGWFVSRGEQAQRDPPRGQRRHRRPGRFGARRRGVGGGRLPATRSRKSAASIRTCASRSARSKGASQRLRDHDHAPGAPVAGPAARRPGHEPRHPGPGRDLDESRRGLDRRRPGRDRHLQPFLRGPGLAQGPGPDSRRRGTRRRQRLRAPRLSGMATQHGLAAAWHCAARPGSSCTAPRPG